MGRGKQKAPGKTLAAVNSVDQKALRNTVETAVNEAVKIQVCQQSGHNTGRRGVLC